MKEKNFLIISLYTHNSTIIIIDLIRKIFNVSAFKLLLEKKKESMYEIALKTEGVINGIGRFSLEHNHNAFYRI